MNYGIARKARWAAIRARWMCSQWAHAGARHRASSWLCKAYAAERIARYYRQRENVT
jgi:hypothetical protein